MSTSRKFGWRSGVVTCRDAIINNDMTINGDLTFGDASVDTFVLKGRMSTMTPAGSSIQIDASTDTYSEGLELRYNMADWADGSTTFTNCKGLYLRTETNEANGSGSVYGQEVYGVSNNVTLGGVWGLLSYAYIKGATAKTIGTAYGVQSELSWDAGAAATTISTEVAPLLAKITGGACADYTKIHGAIIRAGDMDGASRTYGNGILIEDDAGMAGTITWTKGISLTAPCTTGISITGNATDAIKIATGTITNALNVDVGIVDVATRVFCSGAPLGYTTPSLSVGVYGTPVVDTALIDNIAFTANMSTATNKTAADTSCMAGYFGVSNTAATANNKLQGLLISTTVGADCFDAYGVQGHLTLSDNAGHATTSNGGTANLVAGSFKTTVASGLTATGTVSGVLITMDGAGTVTGTHSGLWMDAVVAVDNGILISGAGTVTTGLNLAGTCTSAIGINASTNLFSLPAAGSGPVIANALVPAAAPDAGTVGADACLRVLVNNVAYYVPLYDTLHA